MKKSLLALAVLGAFAGVAQAQSSVTIYGTLDAGIVSADNGSTRQTLMSTGVINSSKLGFRGTEDLGGGLKANFYMESGLNFDNGAAGAVAGTTNQLFTRGASVGLSGGFGSVDLGKISTHSNTFVQAFSPVPGNINAVTQRTMGLDNRGWADNTIAYASPNLSGFSGRVLYTLGSQGAGTQEGLTDATKSLGRGYELGLNYANGPIAVGAFTHNVDGTTVGSGKNKDWGIGASYDFKVAKVGLTYLDARPNDAAATSNKRRTWGISAAAPVTGAATLWAHYARTKEDAGGTILGAAGTGDKKASMWNIGAKYDLSKRTFAYATYLRIQNDSNTNFGSATGLGSGTNAVFAAPANGSNPSAFAVGVAHNF